MIDPLPLEDFFAQLATDPSIRKLVAQTVGKDQEEVLSLMEQNAQLPERFNEAYDAIIEFLGDHAEEADSVDIACLSSYSTTSTVTVVSFAGMHWVTNFEFGNLSYFRSAGDAKKAAEREFGFDWIDPLKPKTYRIDGL